MFVAVVVGVAMWRFHGGKNTFLSTQRRVTKRVSLLVCYTAWSWDMFLVQIKVLYNYYSTKQVTPVYLLHEIGKFLIQKPHNKRCPTLTQGELIALDCRRWSMTWKWICYLLLQCSNRRYFRKEKDYKSYRQ